MRTLFYAAVAAPVYLLCVVPFGLVVRLFRDPLRRRPDPAAASYWTFDDQWRR
ncbi:hypothetical protein [Nonomuraea endophytica]|uniref:hypothetical protein n=1 Tax=Nonomuraea endophytica TaxID=714136 RepID=UPI0037CB9264